MQNLIVKIINKLSSLNRYTKRSIAIITDTFLCVFSIWIIYYLRSIYWLTSNPILEELVKFNPKAALLSVTLAIPIFWIFNLYRTIFRFTNLSIFFNIFISCILYGIFFYVIGTIIIQEIPRPVAIFQPILLYFFTIISRFLAKLILVYKFDFTHDLKKKNILIYGAGDAGRQLVNALENRPGYKVSGFLDDNKNLHRQIILGKTIYPSSKLDNLIKTKRITHVFLAMPTIQRNIRNKIIKKLNNKKIIVKSLPSISEIVDGRITISDIKDLNIDDLLNRDHVLPKISLLTKKIKSKNVLVTGSGGSIGSELCKQIIKLNPNKLILIELNEFALYKVYDKITTLNKSTKVIPLLVNCQDQDKVEKVFKTFKIDTVYHAAAYKHVPLVEQNICEGIQNNLFSTISIVNASVMNGVSDLVLISSDKAVRPTNIMGASKRLSEIYLQSFYNYHKKIKTNFSIVRFGNVLESSGSVIPKFKQQISEGGPITLTHKNITRYFMTVTEAAQLVIQAGAMGKKSEVFVLDMGQSIKIYDLILKMVHFSGLTVQDKNNPMGDIKIKIIGLRSGEKLYEELLIGKDPKKTEHPKILKINDPYIPFNELKKELQNLKKLLKNNEVNKIKILLKKVLKLYNPKAKIIDHIYTEIKSIKNN